MRDGIAALKRNLALVIHGKDEVIELVLAAFCAGGNILMEDVPGVGKTSLARALANSIHGKFNRIQFTPDMLPSDIIGAMVYNPRDAVFSFRRGPVFSNILLADEINRASPRTQSALLEAMSEHQVSVEGESHPLPTPFMVIATENPIEYQGTYQLPEAQLDRFAMRLALGYPDADSELEIVKSRSGGDPMDSLIPVIDCDAVAAMRRKVAEVGIEDSVTRYALAMVRKTRENPDITLGASPRALLSLVSCSKAMAYIAGRDFVLPDDIKKLAPHVLGHRVVLDNKAKYSGHTGAGLVAAIASKIKVPI